MNPREILVLCRQKGIELRADGDELRFKAPVGALTSEFRQVLSTNKQAILEHLQDTRVNASPVGASPKAHLAHHPIPLSFSQQRLWFLDQWEPKGTAYLQSYAWRLHGSLNREVLQSSLNLLALRQNSLRIRFSTLNEQPIQIVEPPGKIAVPLIDLTAFEESDKENQLRRLIREETHQGFDLTLGPLWRAQLIRLGPEEHVFLFLIHHIVTDGWSMGIFWRELGELYAAQLGDRPVNLPPLPLQYSDFAVWQRHWLQGERLDRQLAYWRTQLDGADFNLNLPTDFPRPPQQAYKGEQMTFALSVSLTRDLKSFSQHENATLFMTLLAAFQLLLFRLSGQRDILVGAPTAGRTHTDLEGLIGFFVNTLVLRAKFSDQLTFRDLLAQVRQTCLKAYAHQDLPFEKLVEILQPDRDLSRHPIVQASFQLFGRPGPTFPLPNLRSIPEPIPRQSVKFDLNCSLREIDGFLRGIMEFRTDLFSAGTIQRLVGHYQRLLEEIVDNPDRPISTLPFLSEAEIHQQLVDWNQTAREFPFTQCIQDLFEEQVQKTPDEVAVIFDQTALTYDALNRKANQLAHHLQRFGVGPETIVGIAMKRSLNLMVGLLGILKAGGTYLPLAMNSPNERLAYMLEHSRVSYLLTQQHEPVSILTEGIQTICLDACGRLVARESEINPRRRVMPDQSAYIMYTSGSTGRPKGVVITHRGLVNYLLWFTKTYSVGDGLETLVFSSIGFDLTVTSLFGPLLAGGRVRLMDDSAGLGEIVSELQSCGYFGLLKVTPSHLEGINLLLEPGKFLGRIKTLILGGEILPAQTLAGWKGYGTWPIIVNEYGPTETVVGCCAYQVSPEGSFSDSIPIGRPISNMQMYLLDPNLQLLPCGIQGEVHIGGVALARGYHRRPDLTAERFVPHPFSKEPNARLYKTGDWARYQPDGTIEYKGRFDHQVKIRGFRIELGEIESVLGHHPDVLHAVVLCHEDFADSKQLTAYIVPREFQFLSPDDLTTYLRPRLPDYMLPSGFVFLEDLPLNQNGKVDHQALPHPDQTLRIEGGNGVTPRTPLEELVAEMWRDLLKKDPFSIHDNFFALGGHSLLATQVVSRLRQVLDIDLPLRTLFEHPTVAQLAMEIDDLLAKTFPDRPPDESEDLPEKTF